MATLEKIRSKSVLLFVIIIVALLAFILGDFLTSGRTYFGTGTTIAKAGSAKVDYTDYQNRMNVVADQQRNNSRQTDNDELTQNVIQQLLLEKMLQNEYENLGIKVTNAELTEAMTGTNLHPAAQQFIYQMSGSLGLPNPSGAAVYDAVKNPSKYNLPPEVGAQLEQYWIAVENQVEAALLEQKFDALVNGLFSANEVDAQSMYNDVATTRHISYAAKSINSVPDEEIEVTDDDRRAAYNEDKEMYRLNEPVRAIDYIMVRIEPSEADRVAGTHEVENALETLKDENGPSLVAANPKFVVNTTSSTKSRMTDNRLKAFADTAKVGDAGMLSSMGDNFTLVKLIGVTNEIDSINITMIGRPDGEPLDSLLAAAKAGKPFSELVDNETVVGQDSIWTSLVAPNTPSAIKQALETNAVGEYFVVSDTIQGQPMTTLYRINSRKPAVPYYEFATVDYTIDPSQETLTQLSSDLRTFVSNNSSAEDFSNNAAEAGYVVVPAAVMTSSTHVGNATDSRPAVKWIMNAKKGQVMPVYQDNKQTYLLTAAVKEAYDGDYLPFNAILIADQINDKAAHNKKAKKIVDEYAGKANDVPGYAKLMGVEPQTADAMYNSRIIPGIGYGESAIQGAVAAAEPGQVVGPVPGNNTVVVFVVTGEDNSNREYTYDEYANQFNRTYGIGGTRPLQEQRRFELLLGKDKVKNNSLNLIQGHAEN